MNRWKKNCLIILIYAVMIMLCFGLVMSVDRLLSRNPATEQQPSSSGETDRGGDETDNEESGERESVESGKEPDETIIPEETGHKQSERRKKQPDGQTEEETEPEKPYVPPVLVQASDIHYYSPELTDYGEAFEAMIKMDDGKVITYMPQLLDAFIDEMARLQPSAVVISGDLALNGEKAGHEALAEKLRLLQDKGIQVLVIPGNHDINHPDAASYVGKETLPAEGTTSEDFLSIYGEFGYNQAIGRDEASLSYVYPLDPYNWLLMLDSAQYEPYNLVGGRIREKTLSWMAQVLKLADDNGIQVIPIAHHNLLQESILYPRDCTIENSREVISLLETYRIPVFFSGHLHLQRTKTWKPEPGENPEAYHISEIAADSMVIPPCQYGVLTWDLSGRLSYKTREVDVESWARDQESTDDNLLNFRAYGNDFLVRTISNQINRKMNSLPEEQMEAMSWFYGDLNRAYCAGTPIDSRNARTSDVFKLWERNLPDSRMFKEIDDILRDTKRDHNTWEYQLETKAVRQETETGSGEREE